MISKNNNCYKIFNSNQKTCDDVIEIVWRSVHNITSSQSTSNIERGLFVEIDSIVHQRNKLYTYDFRKQTVLLTNNLLYELCHENQLIFSQSVVHKLKPQVFDNNFESYEFEI